MTGNSQPKLYGTTDATQAVGVSENTLRVYEAKGIVHPQRTQSGRRIFTEADIQAARAQRAQWNRK